ncbi:MAG: ECF-type sigma factor [Planctomycetota bacterium]
MIAINPTNESPSSDGVTLWLEAVAAGDEDAKEELFKATYAKLRDLAGFMMAHQASGHTLQATALLHEATLRMMGGSSLERIADSHHFFATIAQAMRCVLVDHARKRTTARRGADFQRHDLDVILHHLEDHNRVDLLELDDALEKLKEFAPRQAELVNYRFFLGMNFQEIAKRQGVSITTVERDWRFARAWLANQLTTR